MSRTLLIVLSGLLLIPAGAKPAPAQFVRTAAGGALGVVGGGAITMAAVVARARWQGEYLESVNDLIHWQSLPMIVAPITGMVFGYAGPDVLKASVVGSATGLAVGAAVGAGLGWALTEQAEWPWAGGVIGGGLGLAAGGIMEGLRAWREAEDPRLNYPRFLRFNFSIPVR